MEAQELCTTMRERAGLSLGEKKSLTQEAGEARALGELGRGGKERTKLNKFLNPKQVEIRKNS